MSLVCNLGQQNYLITTISMRILWRFTVSEEAAECHMVLIACFSLGFPYFGFDDAQAKVSYRLDFCIVGCVCVVHTR